MVQIQAFLILLWNAVMAVFNGVFPTICADFLFTLPKSDIAYSGHLLEKRWSLDFVRLQMVILHGV